MAMTYLNQAERTELQARTGLSVYSLADLRASFYGRSLSQTDGVRAYLSSQLSLTTGHYETSDLWRRYFISRGVTNQTSLSDMAKTFFSSTGFALINDDFSTNTIASYTQQTGTWTVSGGTLNATVSGGPDWKDTLIYRTGVTVTNFEMTAKIKKPAGNAEAIFRSDGVDGYGIQIRDTNTFRLERFGQQNITQSGNITWVTNSWYRIKINCVGTAIKARVWLDGNAEPGVWDIDTTNATYASGFVGFSVENGTTSFDDLYVVAL